MAIAVTYFADPGCPWNYSINPALTVLQWRYAEQLDWRIVVIGLAESAERYAERGYTPARSARGYRAFRRYGMPFTTAPRRRLAATARACRAIVAARLLASGRELEVLRALQFGWFTSDLVLDEDADIAAALSAVPDLDAAALVAAIDAPDVIEAYQRDRAEARHAAGSATELQGKARNTDGAVRYSAPSLIFSRDGQTLEAGGFQPVEAYDVLIANLDPTLRRRPATEDPLALLTALPWGLTTQEVAAAMTSGNERPDRGAAEDVLIELTASGAATRTPLGDDALWRASGR